MSVADDGDPFADIPPRLCIDRFLPDHLLAAAGQVAVMERPSMAVALRPESILPEGVVRAAMATSDDLSPLIYQRIGFLRRAKWEPGRVIKIGFYDDAPRGVPSKIMAILEEASSRGNLHWRQVPVAQAEYRVGFRRGGGLWSYIGNQSLSVRTGLTCSIGDVNWSDPRDLRRVVFHEICPGHGAGALHAQSLPSYSQLIDLMEEEIIRYYMQSQGWSRQDAEAQFKKESAAAVEEWRATRTSIMAYEIAPRFDRRGVGIPFNWEPDEADWEGFARSYGSSTVGPIEPPVGPSPPPDGTDRLTWGKVATLPHRVGVPSRARLVSPDRRDATIRIRESAAGSPLLDVVPAGGEPLRIPPKAGKTPDVTRFPLTLGGAGEYTVQVQFRGAAPQTFEMIAEKG